MKDQKKAEEIAAGRVQLLIPLLESGIDHAKMRELKLRTCEQTGISERTLNRYLEAYRQEGFVGLKPKGRGRAAEKTIAQEVLEQAVLLRREVPLRSVSQIIRIMEWEGHVAPGKVKRSTLQEHLTRRGYSSRQMKMYKETGIATRRFQQRCRNKLWHSDIKYGPHLPIGPHGTKKQVFLVIFIDDATRFVVHGQFYPLMDQSIIENAFRQAIQKNGVPQTVYFDNGKQYRTRWMSRTCGKLGIRLLYAKPYSPEGKGKVERLNRTVDSFLAEARLEKTASLDNLNTLFQVWLEECYQNIGHSALEGKSPAETFRADKEPLRFVDTHVLADAFLHCETRMVDKVGCISFMGKKYEAGLDLIGRKVDVIYDPSSLEEITIEHQGESRPAREQRIGERAGKRPPLPPHLLDRPAESSRLLTAAKKKNKERQERVAPAVSYRKTDV